MFGLGQIFVYFVIIINFIVCERQNSHGNFLNGLVNLFKELSVHTVWTSTCWDPSVNYEFLLRLSNEDISINFNQHVGTVHRNHKMWYKSGILVDLACDQTSNILQQASKERLFNLQNVWVLFDRRGNSNRTGPREIAVHTFRTYMGRAYALPDSRVYLLIDTDDDYWEIWDGFRLSVTEEVQVSRVGSMTTGRVEVKPSDRTNFQRVILRASTVILEPDNFNGWNKPIRTQNLDVFAHMHYALCTVLSEQLNFTLNLTFSSDYGWSHWNGSFSGLMGELQREEIDFTAAGGLMRADRMDAGEMTVGTFLPRTIVIFRNPPISSINNIFTLPFALSVWTVVFVMILVFTVALIGLTWTSNHLRGKSTQLSTILDTVTMVLGAICQQGLSVAMHSVPARLATFTLFLTAVFLFTSYAANIVVLLQSTSQAIKNSGDLTDKPITFSVQDTTHVYIYLNESLDKNIKKLYHDKLIPQGKKGFTSPEIGLERVRTDFHSFLVEITLAYHIVGKTWLEHEKCSLSELELFKIPLLTLYVVQKSGYKDVIKQKLIQQNEVGLNYRISKNILPQKQKCDSAQGMTNFDSVTMKEIFPALLFLGYGIFTSLLLFSFEHMYKIKITRSKRNKN